MTKTKTISKPYKVLAGGREVCGKSAPGRAEYQRRREAVWDRDRGRCCLCGTFVELAEATAEHIITKGMNGAKRDDRVWNLGVSHWFGNNARGSMSYERYMEKPLGERIKLCHPWEGLR